MQALIAAQSDDDFHALLQRGMNHEQQHQELLLSDILHALSCQPSLPAYRSGPAQQPQPATPLRWLCLNGDIVPLGHDAALEGAFHFDNEGPHHQVLLRDFELASRPVSHGDFMAFMAVGGYDRSELWLSLGWDWLRAGRRRAPLYWQDDGASVFAPLAAYELGDIVRWLTATAVERRQIDSSAVSTSERNSRR